MWLGVFLLVDDYIKLREQVAYVESIQKPNSALQTQERRQQSGMRHDAHSGGESQHGRNEEPKWTDVWLAALTGALALATFALFLDAREKGRLELRAYIGLREYVIRLIPQNVFQIQITIENTGKTNAKDVRIYFDYTIEDSGFTGPFPIGTMGGSMPLSPNGQRHFRTVIQRLTPQDIPRIASDREIFVWGCIEFLDIYNKRQHVKFRLNTRETILGVGVDGTGREVGRIGGWALQPTQDGNDAS